MNATSLSALNGKVVLVCSARDHRNPPTGRRGTIQVHEAATGSVPKVDVEIEFPQMFTSRAHTRRIELTEGEIAQMVASEHNGAFTVTVHEGLDDEAPSA